MSEDKGSAASLLDQEGVAPELVRPLLAAIEKEFEAKPPTIAIIGLSGVGKSTLINALFGTKRDVSATTRGTSRFKKSDHEIVSERVYGAALKCTLRVIDAPGLGEDAKLDTNYLDRYRKHLPEADIALWVTAARNRALALDQMYLKELRDILPNVVLGINQIDLVDPLGWNEAINMPSPEQAENIGVILRDRKQRLGELFGGNLHGIAFSAKRYYNLQALFKACLDEAPPQRRWMFEIMKGFSTRDWLAQAKGLSAKQRKALEEKYVLSDQPIQLGNLPISAERPD